MRKMIKWIIAVALFLALLFTFVACKTKENTNDDLSTSVLSLNIGEELRQATGVVKVEVNESTGAIVATMQNSVTSIKTADLKMPYYQSVEFAFFSDEECTETCDEILLSEKGSTVYVKAYAKPDTIVVSITFKYAEEASGHDHAYGEWTTVSSATCILPGVKKRTCSCGEEEIEAIPALGHAFLQYGKKDATCTEDGWAAYEECSRCGESTKVVSKALGHIIVNGVCTRCLQDDFFVYELLYDETYAIVGFTAENSDLTLPVSNNGAAVTKIASNAFKNNEHLREVVIPEGILSIEYGAFRDCLHLEKITLPRSLTRIRDSFSGCKNLTCVNYSGDIASWCAINFDWYGNPLIYAHDLYIDNTRVNEITIPDTVNTINDYAFQGWNGTELTIPSSVKTIGYDAFHSCENLKKAYYQGDVSSWCSIDFNDGSNPMKYTDEFYFGEVLASEIVIPDTVEVISRYTFEGWKGTKVVMPVSIRALEEYAFHNCVSLEEIEYGGSCESWSEIDKHGRWDSDSGDYIVRCSDGTVEKHYHSFFWETTQEATCIKQGMKQYVCYECGFVDITSSVDKTAHDYSSGDTCALCGKERGLEYSPFRSNYIFPNYEQVVESYCVSGYDGNAATVIIPSEHEGCPVVNIQRAAFKGNRELVTVYISSEIKSIDEEAFANCTSLRHIFYGGTITQWNAIEKNQYHSDGVIVVTVGYAFSRIQSWDAGTGYYVIHCADGDIEKHIHDFEFVTKAEPTCAQTGTKALICKECGKEKGTITIEKTKVHSYDANNVCTVCGRVKGLEFSLLEDGNSYAVSFYDGDDESLVIPSAYQGLPVSTIKEAVFAYKYSLKTITIPKTITMIEANAFAHSRALTEIRFEGTYAEWTQVNKPLEWDLNTERKKLVCSDQVFENLHELHVYNYTLSEVPEREGYVQWKGICIICGVEEAIGSPFYSSTEPEIAADGFGYLYDPEKDGYSIESYAGPATEVIIPESYKGKPVVALGYNSFREVFSVTKITIPASVESIPSSAFLYCVNLAEIIVAEDNPYYCSVGGVLFNSDSTCLVHYPCARTATSYEVPDGVTTIAESAFCYCTHLVFVTIADTVKTIGVDAFDFCYSLSHVTIGSSVDFINDWAFTECYKLREIYNRSSLDIVKGNDSNDAVAKYAKEVYAEDRPSKVSIDENGFVLYTDGSDVTLIGYVGTEKRIVLPETITKIADYAMYRTGICAVTIPRSVRTIDQFAFASCYGLAEVYNNSTLSIEKGSESHGSVAYYAAAVYRGTAESRITIDEKGFVLYEEEGTVALIEYLGNDPEVEVPNGVTEIRRQAFPYGWNGKVVTLPSSIKKLDEEAFYYATTLERVNYKGDIYSWFNISFGDTEANPLYYAHDLYIDDVLVTEIVIPESVTALDYQLCGWHGTAITIPASIISFGNCAFEECDALSKVCYQGDIVDWCTLSFGSKKANPLWSGAELYLRGQDVPTTEIVIPEGIGVINDYLFYGCVFKTLVLGADVIEIGNSAFAYSSVTEIVFAENGRLNAIWSEAFRNSSLVSFVIPTSLKKIGNMAFYDCRDLKTVTYEKDSKLERIGTSAFAICENLISVSLPRSCISLGNTAFRECKNLTSVTFEEDSALEIIGSKTFEKCSSLREIALPASLKGINHNSFRACSSLERVIYNGSMREWKKMRLFSVSTDAVKRYSDDNNFFIFVADEIDFSPFSPLTLIIVGEYWSYLDRTAEEVLQAYVVVCSDGTMLE